MARLITGRKSGFIQRSGRMRRESLWIGVGATTTTLAAASTAALINSLNAAALALRPFTVVRTRGNLFGRSDQTVALENYGGSIGYCIVSDQASAIGVTAVPTPDTDLSSDLWFMIEHQQGVFGFISGVGVLELGQHKDYDSRAMRKVEEGQDLVVVVEANSLVSSWTVKNVGRILVKLH